MGPIGRIKHDVTFRRVRQVAVTVGRKTTTVILVEFVRMRHLVLSLNSAVYNTRGTVYGVVCVCVCSADRAR